LLINSYFAAAVGHAKLNRAPVGLPRGKSLYGMYGRQYFGVQHKSQRKYFVHQSTGRVDPWREPMHVFVPLGRRSHLNSSYIAPHVLAPQMGAQPRLLRRLTYSLRVGKSLRPLCCPISVAWSLEGFVLHEMRAEYASCACTYLHSMVAS
jgi:hypothetical protein